MDLMRKPVTPHPWRLHKWRAIDGLVDLASVARQCERCWLVEVWNGFTDTRVRGPHSMLKEDE